MMQLEAEAESQFRNPLPFVAESQYVQTQIFILDN